MPNIPQSELPKPKSWDEFEDIVWDLYVRLWQEPHADRYGRTGQRQDGVDIVGRPHHLGHRYAGIQCKRYTEGTLSQTIVEREVANAENFVPALEEYIIATTDRRDAALQSFILQMNEEQPRPGSRGTWPWASPGGWWPLARAWPCWRGWWPPCEPVFTSWISMLA
jgi:hypothetical protein